MSKKITKLQIDEIKNHLETAKHLLNDLPDSSNDENIKIPIPAYTGFFLTIIKNQDFYDLININGNVEKYFNISDAKNFQFFIQNIDKKDHNILKRNLNNAVIKKKQIRCDYKFNFGNSNFYWFEITITPDEVNNNKLTLFFFEITKRKNADEQERILADMDKSSSLKSLVSCIAHEINNPNHNIMQNISLLENGWSDILSVLDEYSLEYGDFNIKNVQYSNIRDYLITIIEKILNSSRQIKTIIDDLRTFSQKTQNYTSDQINLNYLVEKTIELLKQQINNVTDNFKILYSTEMIPVLGNANQIQQVIINLIHNSLNAIDEQKQEIKIFTFYNKMENVVGVGVSDKGRGIDSENLNKIFNHFYTLKTGSGGSGLGLPISKEIIDLHNGEITIDSKPGNGTTVIFKLPIKIGRK